MICVMFGWLSAASAVRLFLEARDELGGLSRGAAAESSPRPGAAARSAWRAQTSPMPPRPKQVDQLVAGNRRQRTGRGRAFGRGGDCTGTARGGGQRGLLPVRHRYVGCFDRGETDPRASTVGTAARPADDTSSRSTTKRMAAGAGDALPADVDAHVMGALAVRAGLGWRPGQATGV